MKKWSNYGKTILLFNKSAICHNTRASAHIYRVQWLRPARPGGGAARECVTFDRAKEFRPEPGAASFINPLVRAWHW